MTQKKMPGARMPYAWVLIVDDMVTNLDVAKQIMELYDMNIDCVTCGQDAINSIRHSAVMYDAVFMDHLMPEMDGIETARIIRNEIGTEYAKTVPITALTANTDNENLFLENGFQAYLSKPINIKELDKVLDTWIRKRQTEEKALHAKHNKHIKQNSLGKLCGLSAGGIDFQEAMDRYNDEEAYLNMLRSFRQHTPAVLEKLKSFSGKNDDELNEYRVTIHGLKGVSYGICAKAIGDESKKLEIAAKSGNVKEITENNGALIKMTESLLDDLGDVLQKTSGTETKPHLAAPDTKLLAKLLYAAKIYKASAMWNIMQELESCEYAAGTELVTWLRSKMDVFEYDAIQRRLKKEFGYACK